MMCKHSNSSCSCTSCLIVPRPSLKTRKANHESSSIVLKGGEPTLGIGVLGADNQGQVDGSRITRFGSGTSVDRLSSTQ